MNLQQLEQPLLAPGESMPADLWAILGATKHPVAPLPDETYLRACSVNELLAFLNDREETIARMQADPYRYGYEPYTWKILDAICGLPWADPGVDAIAAEPDEAKRAEMRASVAWCLKVRRLLLRQDEAVRVLLVNGGNRGGKSEWAASRTVKILQWKAGRRAWAFHQDEAMSVEYQQALIYKYLPSELKTEKGIRKAKTYISYKKQTGFSEGRFVLPNEADCSFRYYEQKEEKIEGGELDWIWCDELVPASWIKTLKARIATRAGWLIITFTPVRGYTPTVKMFLDVATPTLESTAFMLPKDGGDPLPELALQGEDARAWVEGGAAQPAVPEGRQFEKVPRVMRGGDRRTAVFFIHSFDNPFGNPRELVELYRREPMVDRKMRFYGVAVKSMSGRFPKFGAAHVVPAAKIGAVAGQHGTRYHIVDPCSGRNWAMIWALVDRSPIGKRIWIYREWPCPGKYVPGVGDMGHWAEPGDKLDGEPGLAQRPLGWGLTRYRQEIDRLEGRRDWERATKEAATPFRFDADDALEPPKRARPQGARPEDGEDIYERRMDSRYGAAKTQRAEGQTTLLEECAEIGLDFLAASGKEIEEGIDLINDLLDYDVDQPITTYNQPRLYVSEECANVIYALRNWTGADGLKGACKDFVDVIRYLVLADPEDWSAETARKRKDAA